MSRVLKGVAAVACLADAGSPPNYEIMWKEFKNTYDKNYNDLDEPLRFATFKENVDYMYETNAKSLSFTLGVTEFADMTNEDFKATYMGYRKPANTWAELPHLGTHTYSGEELAEAVDWVAKGAVTRVKNQGHCGSCWSFSTTGAIEGAWQLATGKLVPLSEQELVDCDQKDHGCHGGVFEYGFQFAQANGMCSETSYPYTATRGACRRSCEVSIPRGGVTGFMDVTRGSMEAVMSALSKQPVSIAIEADQRAFQLYRGGVLSDGCGTQLDHAVLLVGYGTDGGKDYWKVKNSWGPGWGESGYIRLLKGKGGGGECGLLLQPSYPVVKGSEATDIQSDSAAVVESDKTKGIKAESAATCSAADAAILFDWSKNPQYMWCLNPCVARAPLDWDNFVKCASGCLQKGGVGADCADADAKIYACEVKNKCLLKAEWVKCECEDCGAKDLLPPPYNRCPASGTTTAPPDTTTAPPGGLDDSSVDIVKANAPIKCFFDMITLAKAVMPIGSEAGKAISTCSDKKKVDDCLSAAIGLVDHLSALEQKIAGMVPDCDKGATPGCIKGVKGIGVDIHNIATKLKGIKAECKGSPIHCLLDIKHLLPQIKNIPNEVQKAARGCAGRTSYDWCDCGKGTHWIDVWDPSNPSDRHRVPVGGWAPIKWKKSISEIRWVCDGGMSTQRAHLPSNQAWRVSFTVGKKRCGFRHKNTGRIEWDSAGVDTDDTNETSIVV